MWQQAKTLAFGVPWTGNQDRTVRCAVTKNRQISRGHLLKALLQPCNLKQNWHNLQTHVLWGPTTVAAASKVLAPEVFVFLLWEPSIGQALFATSINSPFRKSCLPKPLALASCLPRPPSHVLRCNQANYDVSTWMKYMKKSRFPTKTPSMKWPPMPSFTYFSVRDCQRKILVQTMICYSIPGCQLWGRITPWKVENKV